MKVILRVYIIIGDFFYLLYFFLNVGIKKEDIFLFI